MEHISNALEVLPFLVVTIISAIVVMSSLSFFVKIFSNISLKDELSKKDNFAAGFSLSGALFALGCVIAGASAGDFGKSLIHEIILILIYSAIGVLTLIAARHIFDRFSFPGFSVHSEIMKENTAVGIADMGNTIASGLIIFSVLTWVDSTSYLDVVYVLIAWSISQLILFGATIYRNKVQAKFGKEKNISEQLLSGNSAVAIRFAGYRISIALAIMATTNVISFDFEHEYLTLMSWFAIGIFFSVITTLIGFLLRIVVLRGIDVWDEVESQNNLGIASIQAVLFICSALLIVGITK